MLTRDQRVVNAVLMDEVGCAQNCHSQDAAAQQQVVRASHETSATGKPFSQVRLSQLSRIQVAGAGRGNRTPTGLLGPADPRLFVPLTLPKHAETYRVIPRKSCVSRCRSMPKGAELCRSVRRSALIQRRLLSVIEMFQQLRNMAGSDAIQNLPKFCRLDIRHIHAVDFVDLRNQFLIVIRAMEIPKARIVGYPSPIDVQHTANEVLR